MSNIVDAFSPVHAMPVNVTKKGFDLLLAFCQQPKGCGFVSVELPSDIEDMPEASLIFFNKHFPDLLEQAIEEECEFLIFSVEG
jgi:hypothetical protein